MDPKEKQMRDQWEALKVRLDTGIFKSVLSHLQHNGICLGCVLTKEIDTVTWNCTPIKQQHFVEGWVEWETTGTNHAYTCENGKSQKSLVGAQRTYLLWLRP